MKLNSTSMPKTLQAILFAIVIALIPFKKISAQVCADPTNTIYGLTSSGYIYPITVSNASVGSAINPAYTGNSPSSSNGLGYNSLNGKFYYFKRNADRSTQEFVSYNPAMATVTILASCPTSNTIHTGCVSADGTGYYCIDVNGTMYYYSVATNTWATICSSFYDQYSNDVSAVITSQNSGDIAIDGNGNLWILTSSNSQYGLYKLSAPLPVVSQSSITVREVLSPLTATPNGKSFAGIAFNPTGQILLGTYSDNKLYRMEDDLSLTSLGTFSVNNVGNDLTSCSFPLGVLPVKWESFVAEATDPQSVRLTWVVTGQANAKGYSVEYSADGTHWNVLAYVQSTGAQGTERYSFTHAAASGSLQYYRIHQEDLDGQLVYSAVRTIDGGGTNRIAVWPNPAQDFIRITNSYGRGEQPGGIWLYDLAGRMIQQNTLQPGINTINIRSLPRGTYVIKVKTTGSDAYTGRLVKE